MQSRSTVVWVDNYSGSIYPVDFEAEPLQTCFHNINLPVKSLVDICCNFIVRDSTMTLQAIQTVPQGLCIPLMKEALLSNKDRAMEVLLSHWPMESFSLKLLAPNLFTALLVLYNEAYVEQVIRQGMRYTTTLVHRFVQSLKNGHTYKLKYLDLTGYPTAEVVLFYLSTHCLLSHNETRRKNLVEKFNEAALIDCGDEERPLLETVESSFQCDGRLYVKLDAFVSSESVFSELCKALKVSTFSGSKIQLFIQRLGAIQLGAPAINLILRQINTEHLTALQLHYNSLTCDDLVTLIPALKTLINLTSLDLACNNMNFSTNLTQTVQISECFGALPKLIRLDLSNNRIKCLLRQLLHQVQQPLQYLRLSSCGLRLNDLTYLSVSHHARNLTELYLSSNGLGVSSEILCKLLTAMKSSLKILDLEDCSISNPYLENIQSYIAKLEKILFVNMAENLFSILCQRSFIRTISTNTSIQCVRFSYPPEIYIEPDIYEQRNKVSVVNNLQSIVNEVTKLHPRLKPLQIVMVESMDVPMMDID